MEEKYHRRSIRLQGFDYSQAGYYFVTICTKEKTHYFGKITHGKMLQSIVGGFVYRCLLNIPKHYPNVPLDEYVIMPNHIHVIIVIKQVGVQNFEPLQNRYRHIIQYSLGSIIRGFKIGVTKLCKTNNISFYWQRNYYEHIIRDEKEYNTIRQYIQNNPLNWDADEENV